MKTQKTNNKQNSIFNIFYSKQQFLFGTTIHIVCVLKVINNNDNNNEYD